MADRRAGKVPHVPETGGGKQPRSRNKENYSWRRKRSDSGEEKEVARREHRSDRTGHRRFRGLPACRGHARATHAEQRFRELSNCVRCTRDIAPRPRLRVQLQSCACNCAVGSARDVRAKETRWSLGQRHEWRREPSRRRSSHLLPHRTCARAVPLHLGCAWSRMCHVVRLPTMRCPTPTEPNQFVRTISFACPIN